MQAEESSERDFELTPDMIADFHAESGELVRNMRDHWNAIDAGAEDAPNRLVSLFGNVHTFKGLCGIVGLSPAEETAHRAESLLRRFTKSGTQPTADQNATLGRAIEWVDQAIAAHRNGQVLAVDAELFDAIDRAAADESAQLGAQSSAGGEPSSKGGGTVARGTASDQAVRVGIGELDDLMRILGDLVVDHSRLKMQLERDGTQEGPLAEIHAHFGRSLRELRGAITRARLVPIAEIFSRLPYIVRDQSRECGLQVRLEIEGEDTGVDKQVVDRLKEPLLHLVRNALSHGAEPPDQRRAAGKPEQATLRVLARAEGSFVTVIVEDDGRGMDRDAIATRARASGLLNATAHGGFDLLEILCTPGFSTREEADRAAGRGVGMAVVRDAIRDLGGRLDVSTEHGRGTRFTLRVPLTLTLADMLIVRVGLHTCAIPRTFVERVIELPAEDVRRIDHAEVISLDGGLLPIVRLHERLGGTPVPGVLTPVLVARLDAGRCGLAVDRVLGQREVVARPIRDPLLRVPGIAGATDLGDGRPVLILDPTALAGKVLSPLTAQAQ